MKVENWLRIERLLLPPRIAKLICVDAAPRQNYLFGDGYKSLAPALGERFTLNERLGSEGETKL